MELKNGVHIRQFFKFSLVGILNAIVSYGTFLFLLNDLNYMISLIISHFVGVSNSYIWNKYWTFRTETNHIKEFLKFNSVYGIVLLVNAVSLFYLVNRLNFDPRIGQLILLPIVTIISFSGHKYWSFNGKA